MKSAFQEFNRIDGQIQRSYHEAAVKMGLPDSEFWILYVLATNEPEMLQTELTAITGVSKTTINSALKKMERAGLLELTPGGGRNTCARLTEIGWRRKRSAGWLLWKTESMRAGRRRSRPC